MDFKVGDRVIVTRDISGCPSSGKYAQIVAIYDKLNNNRSIWDCVIIYENKYHWANRRYSVDETKKTFSSCIANDGFPNQRWQNARFSQLKYTKRSNRGGF